MTFTLTLSGEQIELIRAALIETASVVNREHRHDIALKYLFVCNSIDSQEYQQKKFAPKGVANE